MQNTKQMTKTIIDYCKYWDNFNLSLYKLYKKETMKVYKITHKERDHSKTWRKVHSIRFANTQDEALKQLDRHPDLIIKVEFLGYKQGTAPNSLTP